MLDPELTQIVEQEALEVEGRRVVRIEYETLIDVVAGPELHYQYLVSLDPRTTLIVHTTDARGIAGDYDENKTVVDDRRRHAALRSRRARLTPPPPRPPDAPRQAGAPPPGDILTTREAAGPTGLLPLPPSHLRSRKRGVPWARAVAGGVQVLICPDCQHDRPDWDESLNRCEACGWTRLSLTLGQVVCRACGHTARAGA